MYSIGFTFSMKKKFWTHHYEEFLHNSYHMINILPKLKLIAIINTGKLLYRQPRNIQILHHIVFTEANEGLCKRVSLYNLFLPNRKIKTKVSQITPTTLQEYI